MNCLKCVASQYDQMHPTVFPFHCEIMADVWDSITGYRALNRGLREHAPST
jgi:hypothetical protein